MGCGESKLKPTDDEKKEQIEVSKRNGTVVSDDIEEVVVGDGDLIVKASGDIDARVRVSEIVDAVNGIIPNDDDKFTTLKSRERHENGRKEENIQIVKVEVHSSSPGSDENMCYSDMSERSADNDYEDIYQVREEVANHKNNIINNNNNNTINSTNNKLNTRRRSRDSGSHSRSTSISSNGSHVVQVHHATLAATDNISPDDQASLTVTQSTAESGVSSASPSDLGGSEEESENKAKVSVTQRRTLPHPLQDSRSLKRTTSEPSYLCPPPPPPPPPAEDTPIPQARTLPLTPVTPRVHKTPNPPSLPPTPRQDVFETTQDGVTKEGGEESELDEHEAKSSSGPANRQMVLPFIPPKFNAGAESDSLIKPSEYLKSLGSSKPSQLASLEAVIQHQAGVRPMPSAVAPKDPTPHSDAPSETNPHNAPPPPPLPLPDAITNMDVCPHPTAQGEGTKSETTKQHQPLGAISVHELNSVQLRRTDKMLASKTLSAPPTTGHHASVMRTQPKPDQPYLAQKTDLIAELKLSKDITGIKKMKVERAKVEERQEKELFSEITKQLTVDSFVEQIPDTDNTGNPIPPWKRQMLAKKAADRARKELEEQKKKEAEEKRLKAIPAWKRQLLAKKDEVDPKKVPVYTPRVVEEKRVVKPLTNGTTVITVNGDSNKENTTPVPVAVTSHSHATNEVTPTTTVIVTPYKEDEDPTPVMPWRSQLRKTNSKLNLLE